MYIVAIAWIYVVFMMSITEESVVAGLMTLLLYGILPLSIVLYIMGTPQRKRRRAALAAANIQATAPATSSAGSPAHPDERVENLGLSTAKNSASASREPHDNSTEHQVVKPLEPMQDVNVPQKVLPIASESADSDRPPSPP